MAKNNFRVIMAKDSDNMVTVFTDASNPSVALSKALKDENLKAADIVGASILNMSVRKPEAAHTAHDSKPVPFYLASSLANAARVRELSATLSEMNMIQTYDWTTHGSVIDEDDSIKAQIATNEAEGVMKADLVVVMLPSRLGTHTELGMAIASGKKIIVWSEWEQDFIFEESVIFYYHPGVERLCCEFEHLVELIKLWRADR